MAVDEKNVNLKKMGLPQLQELRDRQHLILKNKNILKHLTDKGDQVKKFLEKIEIEIKEREAMARMENLNLNDPNSSEVPAKYVQHICNIEKLDMSQTFKPFKIYDREKDKIVPKETSSSHQNQYMALKESVALQAVHIQEEHGKAQYRDNIEESSTESEKSSDNESDLENDQASDN